MSEHPAQHPHRSDPGLPLKVLVAEDNPVVRLATSVLLHATCKALVRFAEHGEAAVAAAVAHEWDLVLMDLQMPVLDGLEATRRIRDYEARHPTRRRSPIIAYTTRDVNDVEGLAASAGIDEVLLKPAGARELAAVVSKWTGVVPFAIQGK